MAGAGILQRLLLFAVHCLVLRSSYFAANAQTVGIVCFGVGGQSYVNNTRCPGSNACCGVKATCLSNRLCHNPGDSPELWVRGPCAASPFDASCAQICLYNETETGGGVLPRVTPCENGSLCCNNDPQCCSDGRGVFLDENGNRASARATAATTSYPPLGTGTERFTQTSSVSTTSSPTGSITSITSPGLTSGAPNSSGTAAGSGESGSGDQNAALKVGLGVGMPMTVLVTALAVYFWLRRRNKNKALNDATPSGTQEMSVLFGGSDQNSTPSPPPKQEISYYSGQPLSQPAELGSPQISELPAQRRYELD